MSARPEGSHAITLALGLILATCATHVASHGQERSGGFPAADAVRAYLEWVAKLHSGKFLGDVNAKWDATPSVLQAERMWFDRTEVELKGAVGMRFDVDSGRLVRFWNDAAWAEWARQQGATSQVSPDWSEETALHRAQDVLRLFLGSTHPMPRRLRQGDPFFHKTGDQRGVWTIDWIQELNGYPLEVGGWFVLLHEQFGLISYSLGDVYDACPTEIRIGRREALRSARNLVEKAFPGLTWDSTHEGITGLRAAPLLYHHDRANGSLMIVHPNDGFQELGGVGRALATSERVARLSYVIEFEPKEGHCSQGDPDIIIVYLDAGDGRIVGGSWSCELDPYYKK